ncbi:aromatic ring-hydroxylating oxygenase subunit alpha [Oceanicoccus sagamiensis]|uniref:Rieske domain-containing protein n=1 Tax=Oceanicoccus sagamiensis TaxID=716816 RepID=A0A1X9NP66_9GAMM|nr:aromatic ring-hydroxylating dioxygenase subunit alpha [Oceanicoccus sagamiensis]ARN75683.1 hypothetical protein BST96_17160 [Oceanicoccus sagamiensis]
MDPQHTALIKQQIAEAYERQGAPEGFPAMPDIPVSRYISDEFWQAEQQQLWPKTWLFAGHKDELPNIGSSKLWQDAGVPVVIVKDEQQRYRAFYNTCQHRAGPLVVEEYAEQQRLRCGYHGWTYNFDGDLIGVPDRRDFIDLDLECNKLLELRCESWGGCLFVNRDPDAISLDKFLMAVKPELEQFAFDQLQLVDKHSIDIAANWKACTDSFMETYHLRHIHPHTVDTILDHKGTVISLLEQGHNKMYTPNRMGFIPPQAGFDDIPTVEELPRMTNLAYSLFPNVVIPLDAGGFPILVFWPVDKANTRMDIWWFAPVTDANKGKQVWRDQQQYLSQQWLEKLAIFDVVLGEDVQFLPSQQQSMETGAIQGMTLSYLERRIYHRHESIDQIIGSERIPEGMAVAPVLQNQIEA